MSSFAQQPRSRPVRARSPSPQSTTSRSSSPQPDSASPILLFAPPRPQQTQDSWDVLPPHSLAVKETARRALSPASASSSTSTSTPPIASPETLTRSLFPSHDGNGIFTTESLLLSEASDASYASPSDDSISSNQVTRTRTGRRARASTREARWRSDSGSSSFDNIRISRDSLGGSWALTEEALSALPDADEAITINRRRAPSVADTSSSSSDKVEDEEEEALRTTPHAASAGLGWSRWRKGRQAGANAKEESSDSRSREAYPSPPPLSMSRRMKRRHRIEGRGAGSQKRSSASGSARGSGATPAQTTEVLPVPPTVLPSPLSATPIRTDKVLFAKLVSKLVD
ncbi:hypothetical protein P7C70_g7540, partial [Phenoliferia sp. Uapishka_3]